MVAYWARCWGQAKSPPLPLLLMGVPAIPKEDVEAAESRFLRFSAIASLILVSLVTTLFVPKAHEFWAGNRLWGLGSYITFVSVLHIRFFDVRKVSSPDNRRVRDVDRTPWIRSLERVVNLAWIVGFAFIASSRWLQA